MQPGERDIALLELRLATLESSVRQLRGLLERVRREVEQVSRAEQIARQVAAEIDRTRILEREHLSTLWARVGIVAIVTSTVASTLALANTLGLL